jgi:D-alanyl-lipoteichoic acid acyltransferase DltB (MBOAT superfamily)
MPFDSLLYFLFLPLVYLVFVLAGDRFRWGVLLAASLGFYAALNAPHLLLVLALVVTATYGIGLRMGRSASPRERHLLLWAGVSANLLALVLMKYLPFLVENLRIGAALLSVRLSLPPVRGFVAIGVSYFVFQAISYLADIYLEIEEPEPHFGTFALYMAFFPKLLQGPIERAGALLPQLRRKFEFDYDSLRYGLTLFLWGLFKKVVLADRLGLFANSVFNDVHAFRGLPLLLATYAYAFQIYWDFSAYTDMALGTARIFNITLTDNFNQPYLSTSIAEFWRRWHITFSRWIFDYIFKPLQMSWRDAKTLGAVGAILVTFLASGLWHGASWCFIVWGLLHGLYLAASMVWKPYQKPFHKRFNLGKSKAYRVWQTLVTFHLVALAWIFFRAQSIRDAWYVLTHLLPLRGGGRHGLSLKAYVFRDVFLNQGFHETAVLAAFLVGMALLALRNSRPGATSLPEFLAGSSRPVRWSLTYGLLACILVFAIFGHGHFIYYQF